MKNVQISSYFQRKKIKGAVNTLPSLTMPDMALSMRQILERFARGQSIPQNNTAHYSEEDLTEFEKMDKFEKMDAAAMIREDIKQMQQDLVNQQQSNPSPSPSQTHITNTGDKQEDKTGDKTGDKA